MANGPGGAVGAHDAALHRFGGAHGDERAEVDPADGSANHRDGDEDPVGPEVIGIGDDGNGCGGDEEAEEDEGAERKFAVEFFVEIHRGEGPGESHVGEDIADFFCVEAKFLDEEGGDEDDVKGPADTEKDGGNENGAHDAVVEDEGKIF